MAFSTWPEIRAHCEAYDYERTKYGVQLRDIYDPKRNAALKQEMVYRIMLDCGAEEEKAKFVIDYIDELYHPRCLESLAIEVETFAIVFLVPFTQKRKQIE